MKCSKCGIEKDPSQFERWRRQCKDCMKGIRKSLQPYDPNRKRIYFKNHPEKRKEIRERYKQKYPEKEKAEQLLQDAVKYGKVLKQPCEICGGLDVHGHHADYSRPLEVKWLCVEHHNQLHNGR